MLQINEPAQADLKEIWLYLAERNVDTARQVIAELLSKFRLLESNPALGRERHELIVNLRSFPYKKYLIFYLPINDGVEILRVLHAARNIEDVFTDYIEGLDE